MLETSQFDGKPLLNNIAQPGTIAMSQQVLAQAPQQPQPQPQPQQQSQQQPPSQQQLQQGAAWGSGGSLNLIGASSNGNNGRNIVPPGQKWGDAADSDETVAWAAGNIVRGQPGVHNLRPVMDVIYPDEPPPVSLIRDEKMRHLLDHISRQQDPTFKNVLVGALLQWINRSNVRRNRSADTEIMWKNTSAFSDPLLPSNAIGNFTELILGHLASTGARHVYEGMTGQFSQICTAMSFEVTQASEWHRQQLQGKLWSDQMFAMQPVQRQSNFGVSEFEVSWPHGSIAILHKHYDELVRLYMSLGLPMNQIIGRIFNMVQRYETINYLRTEHQPVLPTPVFDALKQQFGVNHECFASPLNRHLDNYCSQFPDTDRFFNSSGSFFDFFPTSGSFVAHPPPVQQDVIQMFAHMIGILQGSSQPLSFFVFAPIFDTFDPMRNSAIASFMVRSVIVQRGKHMLSTGIYFRGTNSNQSLQEVNFLPNNDSGCYWLQNASGRQQWPVTDDRVNKVISSFLPVNTGLH